MDGTCSAEICIRIASAIAAMARLNRIWCSNTITFANKFKLYKSLVTSILHDGFETWTLLHLDLHLSPNCKGHWGTTDDFTTSFLYSSVLHCPLGLCKLQAYPFPGVVFQPLLLSALPSSPFHCDLQDGFGQTWWMGDMSIPFQFVSLSDGQEVLVWSNCLLNLGRFLLVTWALFGLHSILQ